MAETGELVTAISVFSNQFHKSPSALNNETQFLLNRIGHSSNDELVDHYACGIKHLALSLAKAHSCHILTLFNSLSQQIYMPIHTIEYMSAEL